MAGMPADPVGPFIPTTPLEHKNFSEMDVLSGSLVFMMMVILVFILMRLYRQYRLLHYEVPARDIGKGHKWYMVDSFEEPGYCVISQCRISHGAQCDSCGVCVDDHNMKKANAIIKCKALSETKLDYTPHHWTQATVPYDSNCYRCYENCGLCQKGCNFFCSWCHRTAHSACLNNLIEVCDLGEFKNLIVPPNCVTLKWAGMKGRRHLVVGSAKEPLSSLSNWNPLIVVANRKSGNNDGEYMLRAFRSYLNPTQVIDLNEVPPENALEWCHILPTVTFKVLVCGGDGTVSWVLDAIEKLHLENCPQVGILPLGTGNDLSRVLGWGEGYTHGDVNTSELLRKILTAKPVHLDRWKVEIRLMKSLVKSRKEMTMNNYASIGVDALVTLNFHRSRESRPWLFAHRFINKLAYFTYGTKDVLERECKHLEQKITVHLDDVEVALPEIEGLVVLNIASWGGGCQPWTLDREHEKFRPARYDDGYLEVMVLYSSFHIAQLQVGLASPHRLGQAKKVKIFLHGGKVPMQVDGEPWEQKYPAEINIQHHGRAIMLVSHPNT